MITGNEPAMPATDVNNETGGFIHYGGLTIRQYFAAMAMHGINSNTDTLKICAEVKGLTIQEAKAKMAVQDADALIAELNKE